LLRPIGNTVYFMPPYVVQDAEFALLVEAGLAIVDELARAMGGLVEVRSRPGSTRFSIRLPAVPAPTRYPSVSRASA